MSRSVWKYILTPAEMRHYMPAGAEILHVHEQNGDICLWALVDPDAAKEQRNFVVLGTGHLDDRNFSHAEYIGSSHLRDGLFVFHVFEPRTVP